MTAYINLYEDSSSPEIIVHFFQINHKTSLNLFKIQIFYQNFQFIKTAEEAIKISSHSPISLEQSSHLIRLPNLNQTLFKKTI